VIDTSATLADAAATALFVAGPDAWYTVAQRLGVRFVMLVDREGAVHLNPAMRRRLRFERQAVDLHVSEPL
jgi:thiamine biosynthesis lipoprotein